MSEIETTESPGISMKTVYSLLHEVSNILETSEARLQYLTQGSPSEEPKEANEGKPSNVNIIMISDMASLLRKRSSRISNLTNKLSGS